MSQDALELLLSGVKDQAQRKQITSAYYAFANGDPETFAVQFAVLLRAHSLSLKVLPQQLQKAFSIETHKLSDLVSAHQSLMNKVASLASQSEDHNGVGEKFEQTERRIEKHFALYYEVLKSELANILSATTASHRALQQVAAHRIALGLILSYTAGALSVLAVQHFFPFLL